MICSVCSAGVADLPSPVERDADVVDDHFRPGGGHRGRDLAADAAAGTGHQDDFSCHHSGVRHSSSSS